MPTPTSRPTGPAARRRLIGAGAVLALGALCAGLLAAPPASAMPANGPAPAPAPTSTATLQAQAADVAGRIDALDEQLSVLAESYDQAQLVVEQADATLAAARADAARAEQAVADAQATLRGQAVSAYLNGGPRQHTSAVPQPYRLNGEDGIRRNYTRAAVDATQKAIDAIHQTQRALASRQKEVATAAGVARGALAKAQADRDAAASTEAAQRGLLAQVQGRLGALVRAEQARRAAAAATAAKAAALARQQAAQHPTASPASSQAPTTTTRPPSSGGSHQPSPTTTTTSPPPPPASPPPPSSAPLPAPNATKANKALAAARAQLGKPYQWGGAGPDSFDCSGLTAWAWKAAGVYLPHSSMAQYKMLPFVPLDKLAPGDLVFYGSDIHHVGLYVGGGQMIEAPHTGANVRYASIWRSDIVGGGRPT